MSPILSNMPKRLYCAVLLWFISVFPIFGRTREIATTLPSHYYIKPIGTTQGLTNPCVTDIHTDSDGAVWIGTRYLLNKYINGEMVSYGADMTGGSYITMLYEDSDGNIWVGTESSLSKYDRDTDRFTLICPYRVNCALECKGKYFFAGGGGIIVLDTKDDRLTRMYSTPNQIIKSFVVSEDVLLFVDRVGGVYRYNVPDNKLEKLSVPELEGCTIRCACMDGDSIYLAVHFKGVYQIDVNGNVLNRYLVKDNPDLWLEVIHDIEKIGSRIWLATDGSGICVIDGNRVVPLSEIPQYHEISDIPTTTASISEDCFSNIWIGSVREGLFGIKATSILHSSEYADKTNGRNNAILSMTKAKDGIWLGTNNGLLKYSASDQKFERETNCRNDLITSLVNFKDDQLLISSFCKGLYIFNTETKTKTPFIIQNPSVNKTEIMSGVNLRLTELSKDEILITGENVYRYDIKSDSITRLATDFGTSSEELHTFYVSKDKSVAYAYSEEKFYQIDLVGNLVKMLYVPEIQGDINAAEFIHGSIYYGTDYGLKRYDIEKEMDSEVYSGLFKRISNLCRKSEYAFWVSTGSELFSIDTESHIVEMYDEAEGFSMKEVQVSKLIDGYYYFGGVDNMSIVPANIFSTIEDHPSISMTGVSVDGHNVPIEKNKIKIAHNHSTVDFQFISRGSDPFRKTLLKYALSGPESWHVETYDLNYSLSRLSYGKYTLSASYLSSDGFWSVPVECLSIQVSKPFFQRGWVIAAIILLLASAITLIIFLNSRKSKIAIQSAIMQNRKIEKERRSRFVKNIEAEMANPLSQISKVSKALLDDTEASIEKQKKSIEKIYSRSVYLEKMLNVAIGQERPEEEENPVLQKFNSIIDSRISDPNLDVNMLVQEMAMSRSTLYDKIKELTGMGVNEYIQNRKMVKARKLLIDTDLTVTEISEELGFSSSKYFSEIFKKAFEVSPREFKKRIMN